MFVRNQKRTHTSKSLVSLESLWSDLLAIGKSVDNDVVFLEVFLAMLDITVIDLLLELLISKLGQM